MDEGNDDTCLELGLGLSFCKRDHPPKEEKKRGFFLDFSISNHPLNDDHDSNSSLKTDFRDDESNFSCRKKLRLTCDQTTWLEDSFKQRCTLNMTQKHALAEKLNLKPRQVEVWFQNRRARTKLKQTEIDCEFLKKNWERLSEENWRLKKELIELRSTIKMEKAPSLPPVLYNNIIAKEAATLRKCPLCVEHDSSRKNKDLVVMEVVHEPKPNNMHQGRAVVLS